MDGALARLERNPAQLTALAPKSSTLSTAWQKVGSSVLYRRICYTACRGKYTKNEITSSSLFVSLSGSSETLLGLAIAPPIPNELHSWLKLKAAYN